MARYIVLHPIDLPNADLKNYTSEATMGLVKKFLNVFTDNTYTITTWAAVGAGKAFCLWEAPSEQAIVDILAKVKDGLPTSGIFPVSVIDWAEMKKVVGG